MALNYYHQCKYHQCKYHQCTQPDDGYALADPGGREKHLFYRDYGIGKVFFYFYTDKIERVLVRYPKLQYDPKLPHSFSSELRVSTEIFRTFDIDRPSRSVLLESLKNSGN